MIMMRNCFHSSIKVNIHIFLIAYICRDCKDCINELSKGSRMHTYCSLRCVPLGMMGSGDDRTNKGLILLVWPNSIHFPVLNFEFTFIVWSSWSDYRDRYGGRPWERNCFRAGGGTICGAGTGEPVEAYI